jgi:hypothetical protein
MDVSESLLKKLSFHQQSIINALIKKPNGILSRELTHRTGISNKSDVITKKLTESLAKENLEIHIERVSKQWLWKLSTIKAEKKNK